jgi:hypothetical protein
MTGEERVFFQDMIAAGAILGGFCSTFLAFRIQREANYYRQAALSYEENAARDIYIGLTQFTSSLLLIILAAICSIVFGFLLPLFALAGACGGFVSPELVVGGLVAALLLLAGYFFDEMVRYGILSQQLLGDAREWKNEWPIVVATLLLALGGAGASYWLV